MIRFIVLILLLTAIPAGCSSRIPADQRSGSTIINDKQTTWHMIPAPKSITIYSNGKSKEIPTSNPEYLALANRIDSVLTRSNLDSADMYQLSLPPGGNFSHTNQSGVELVYSTPFNLTTRTCKPSVYRLFILCNQKPMLFIGIKNTNDYWGSGLGPLVISNTDDLAQLVNRMIKQN